MMRTIITGSKATTTYNDLIDAIGNSPFTPTEIVSSVNRWGDELGERFARDNNLPITRFTADVNKYGKEAEYENFIKMIDYAELVIVLWCGMSEESQRIVNIAKSKGICVHMHVIKSMYSYEYNPIVPW